MKKILIWLVAVLISLSVIGAAGGYFYYSSRLGSVNPQDTEERLFYVSPGSPFNMVLNNLKKNGYIKDPMAGRLYTTLNPKENKMQPGYYQLKKSMSLPEIVEKLYSGKIYQVWLTIPEGFNIRKIAAAVDKKDDFSGEAYLKLARTPDEELKSSFVFLEKLSAKDSLEGYLFPDTYDITGGTEADLVNLQLKRFEGTIYEEWLKRPANWPYNLHETLTLSSIVELEAVKAEERPVIAGVFVNRLKQGIALGADPTVEYALGWHQGNKGLSYEDIKINSPYNTYRNAGLPPGPISNPGLASFKATLNYQDTPYLYFVARGDGSHVFTTNYQDHLAAQRRIKTGQR